MADRTPGVCEKEILNLKQIGSIEPSAINGQRMPLRRTEAICVVVLEITERLLRFARNDMQNYVRGKGAWPCAATFGGHPHRPKADHLMLIEA